MRLISEAAELVHAGRFMTPQFNLQASAPCRPSRHWAAQCKLKLRSWQSAKQSADMTRMMLRMEPQ